MSYATLDYLPDLSPGLMASAIPLTLTKVTDPSLAKWEYSALYGTAQDYAILHDTFSFQGVAGATYDIASSSFLDPFLLEVFDAQGNAIAVDDGQMPYGYDHTSFVAPYSGTYYINASWDQGLADGDKACAVGVFEDLDTIPKPNVIVGTSGDDKIGGTIANDQVDGGAGVDTFYLSRQREHYSVTVNNGVITVYDWDVPDSNIDTLTNVERIHFFDGTLSFETSGIDAQAYRLYQAAFGRTPDAGGLGYWINDLQKGDTLTNVANAFVGSAEFKNLYGTNPTNEDVLAALYKNVLHRTPDSGGHDYWMSLLSSHAITVVDMLVAFSESTENQAQVIGSLKAGFFFTNT